MALQVTNRTAYSIAAHHVGEVISVWLEFMVNAIAKEIETVLKIMQRANSSDDDVKVEIDAGIKILLSLNAELKSTTTSS
ncbi:hypothetical protein [Photobacterium leiognathi]|uniref:hypothetical protein n=1 Tax=Photobacterium leiognathi TaxID=553611 RepID=UPI00273878E3|nr:hypothetical protein [Photobacterium leiognathi]